MRNGLIDLMRFFFSLLVVFYHLMLTGLLKTNLLTNAYIAVEFFLLLSGHFFAMSITKTLTSTNSCGCLRHKAIARDVREFFREFMSFMWRKVRIILPYHIVAIFLILGIIFIFDRGDFFSRFKSGLPNIFLVQMAFVWCETRDLIKSEWYLSAVLLLFMWAWPLTHLVGGALIKRRVGLGALAKRIKLILPIIIFFTALLFFVVVFLATGKITWTLLQDLRAAGVLTLGMGSFYIKGILRGRCVKIAAGVSFIAVFIFSIFFSHWVFYALSMGLLFFSVAAISNLSIKDSRANRFFIILGRTSLPIYIFHFPIIDLVRYLIK